MSERWIEIGSGEGGHYDWEPEFLELNEVGLILNQFESEGKLNIVKEQTPYWKHSKSEPDIWTLIDPFVRSEREIHDPDQPIASVWEKVFLEERQKQHLLEMISKTLMDLRALAQEHLVKRRSQNDARLFESMDSNQFREQQKKSDLVSQIVFHLRSGTKDLECFGNFLVSMSSKQIYYLTEHQSYRKELPDEDLAARELEKGFDLIRTYESSQPDDPWIAHFAGSRRLQVMGWGQTHSRLHHQNEDDLQALLRVRRQFNRQVCEEDS